LELNTPNERTRKQKYQKWRVLLNALGNQTLSFFPEDYGDSIWCVWEQRIIDGQKGEKDWIERKCKDCEQSGWDSDTIGDLFAEDFGKTSEVTDIMYAALIVSVWAEIEALLENARRVCCLASNKPYRKFIKARKRVEWFHQEFDSKTVLERCVNYEKVNALRILNNAFKHDRGKYRLYSKDPFEQIEGSVLQRWKIAERGQIRYANLPLAEIVSATNSFCRDLLSKVEAHCKSKQ
jgi:hypothetical protein